MLFDDKWSNIDEEKESLVWILILVVLTFSTLEINLRAYSNSKDLKSELVPTKQRVLQRSTKLLYKNCWYLYLWFNHKNRIKELSLNSILFKFLYLFSIKINKMELVNI